MRTFTRRALALLLALLLPLTALADVTDEYLAAQNLLARNRFAEAADAFTALGGYEDASVLAMYCRACAMGESGEYDMAIAVLRSMGDYKDCTWRVTYYQARQLEAAALAGDAEAMAQARALYNTIPLFLDSLDRITALDEHANAAMQAQYDAAVALADAEDFAAAKAAFRALEDYLDSAARVAYCEARELEAALTDDSDASTLAAVAGRFAAMGDYLDCPARLDAIIAVAFARADALALRYDYNAAWRLLAALEPFCSERLPEKYFTLGEYALAAEYTRSSVTFFTLAAGGRDATGYAIAREQERALGAEDDLGRLTSLLVHYAMVGDLLDSADRSAALTARRDALVAAQTARSDALAAQGRFTEAIALLDSLWADPVTAYNITPDSDGNYSFSLDSRTGHYFTLLVSAGEAEKLDAALELLQYPPLVCPFTLEPESGWELTLQRQSRGTSYLRLTLPNGGLLNFRADKTQLNAVNEALSAADSGDAELHLEAADGSGTLRLTRPDGTVLALQIYHLEETRRAWDSGADFFFSATGDAVTIHSERGTVTLTLSNLFLPPFGTPIPLELINTSPLAPGYYSIAGQALAAGDNAAALRAYLKAGVYLDAAKKAAALMP